MDLSKNTKLTELECCNNQRTVANGTELTAMDPNFDSTKVSSIEGGSWNVTPNTQENGVTAGYPGGRFAPNDEVNREQLAVMLHGYRKKPAATEPLTFVDTEDISDWAENSLQWAVENHMMSGAPGNKLLPQGLAERSQGAVIMINFDQTPKN